MSYLEDEEQYYESETDRKIASLTGRFYDMNARIEGLLEQVKALKKERDMWKYKFENIEVHVRASREVFIYDKGERP